MRGRFKDLISNVGKNTVYFKPKQVVFLKDGKAPITIDTSSVIEVQFNNITKKLTIQELV